MFINIIRRFDLCCENRLKQDGYSHLMLPSSTLGWEIAFLVSRVAAQLRKLLLRLQPYFIRPYYAGWILLVKDVLCEPCNHPSH